MTLRVEVRFEPRSLVRANDGLDLDACSARYAAAVKAALEVELGPAIVVVVADPAERGVRVLATGATETDNWAAERTALDVAWVVRETVPFG